jgi:pimeloyl-ACP methyl ester carboxylesterase
VAAELRTQGFTVFTPPNPLRGAGDAAYISSFVAQRTTGPVVLVGHSYGGFVITNAATGGGDVKALVFVDAFIPDVGETTFQILGGSGSALAVPDPTTVLDLVGYPGAPEGDVDAFLKPDTVHNSFAQDLPEADRWLIVQSQRPLTLSANTTGSQGAGWKSLPNWVVIGTQDRVIPPDRRRDPGRGRRYRLNGSFGIASALKKYDAPNVSPGSAATSSEPSRVVPTSFFFSHASTESRSLTRNVMP